ncbi:MAG: 50S ribosomal protein L11 methyltransferase [Firmicutes bacterium]|nr:50S ribosomal protein L11 methyltransferase [Bacillota bacterium]
MRWLEVTIISCKDSGEAIAQKLHELGTPGVVLEEAWDYEKLQKDGLGDLFPETAVLADDVLIIRGYFPVSFLGSAEERELTAFLRQLPCFGLSEAKLQYQYLEDDEWAEAWKEHWQPTPVGERLLIVPVWREVPPAADRLLLLLDPGTAFGTGTHESTRLALELLERKVKGKESVLDLGCGSGILALAAKLYGAGAVMGIDYDEMAVKASRNNAALNGLTDVSFRHANLFRAEIWQELTPADLITANLTADILLRLKEKIVEFLLPGGCVIMSGIVKNRREEVVTAFLECGCHLSAERSAGEWVAFLMEKRS